MVERHAPRQPRDHAGLVVAGKRMGASSQRPITSQRTDPMHRISAPRAHAPALSVGGTASIPRDLAPPHPLHPGKKPPGGAPTGRGGRAPMRLFVRIIAPPNATLCSSTAGVAIAPEPPYLRDHLTGGGGPAAGDIPVRSTGWVRGATRGSKPYPPPKARNRKGFWTWRSPEFLHASAARGWRFTSVTRRNAGTRGWPRISTATATASTFST